MAKIKYSALVSDMRGKLNGSVASRNTYGSYLRNKVTPVNPSTVSQQGVRNSLTTNSQDWRGLTDDQRKLWNQSAINFTRTNIFGDVSKLTGFNLFMRLNGNLKAVSSAVLANAPQPADIFGFSTLAITANTTGSALTIAFTAPIPAGTKAILKATAPVSAGISFVKSEYRQIAVLTNTDTSPFDAEAAYVTKFGALPPVGSKIFMSLKAINTVTGQDSQELTASAIAV